MDEAGRGPLAGPLVAAAVVLDPETPVPGVEDSKRLRDDRRRELLQLIEESALAVSTGHVEPDEIDGNGMAWAVRESFLRAASGLVVAPDLWALDGLPLPGLRLRGKGRVRFFVRGDSRSSSIAAAGIVAKVTRDDIMLRMAEDWPGYGFESHKGYCTREHLQAIHRLGPCPIHRFSFSPLKEGGQLPLGL